MKKPGRCKRGRAFLVRFSCICWELSRARKLGLTLQSNRRRKKLYVNSVFAEGASGYGRASAGMRASDSFRVRHLAEPPAFMNSDKGVWCTM